MKRMKSTTAGWVAAALVSLFLLAGCGATDGLIRTETPDVKPLVQDYSSGKIKGHDASITSHELIVNDGGKKITYDLPEDEFFVSIAPYLENTHPCEIHSLTGCRGEMPNEAFHVTVVDADGNTVLDQTMESQANGFIDLWLPRDQKFRITITRNGKTAEAGISTFAGDNTCITTMQLK